MKTVKYIGTTAVCALAFSIAQAATITIDNSSFENDWTDWTDSDPSAISSSDAYSGSKSAKVTGSGGGFEQTVSVSTNTDYVLTAWIFGQGTISATAGSSINSASVNSSVWEETTVSFNSGSNTSVTIAGGYDGGEGRFDLFSLESAGGGTGSCTSNDSLVISSATDDGTNDGHGPSLTIDNSLADESRWSSNGAPKAITYDLGANSDVTQVEIAFYKGDTRSSYFYIETSSDASNWTSVYENGVSSGSTESLELFDVTDTEARYVRITGNGNSANSWNSILETNILGCGDVDDNEGGGSGDVLSYDPLDPNVAPSSNFELTDWYVSVPLDDDGNGKPDDIKNVDLVDYELADTFYTASDGGMVFKTTIEGAQTEGTSYSRTELREMLRRGDTSIDTSGVNKNNWVFSSASSANQSAAGGVDGTLTAVLAVNAVTTTGDAGQVGRVIVGQIHATDDEPARLYYRLLPGHTKGSIYLAHEPVEGYGDEQWYDLIGSRADNASEPSDGIELDEKFGYTIDAEGDLLTVTIYRDGKADVVQEVNMASSGFDGSDQYMYFKAGVYLQDNTGNANDYGQATFYKVENTHDGYAY